MKYLRVYEVLSRTSIFILTLLCIDVSAYFFACEETDSERIIDLPKLISSGPGPLAVASRSGVQVFIKRRDLKD